MMAKIVVQDPGVRRNAGMEGVYNFECAVTPKPAKSRQMLMMVIPGTDARFRRETYDCPCADEIFIVDGKIYCDIENEESCDEQYRKSVGLMPE